MLEFLLSAELICADAKQLVARAKANQDMSDLIKVEIINTIKDATERGCNWDAND